MCMECGACSLNCPADAIEVKSGVGCAAAVLHSMLKSKINSRLRLSGTKGDNPFGLPIYFDVARFGLAWNILLSNRPGGFIMVSVRFGRVVAAAAWCVGPMRFGSENKGIAAKEQR
jgi:ferredoxin